MNSRSKPMVSITTAGSGAGLRVLRILLPVLVEAVGVAIWELLVRINNIPPYVLPSPLAVLRTLVSDWSVLSRSLVTTLLVQQLSANPFFSRLGEDFVHLTYQAIAD